MNRFVLLLVIVFCGIASSVANACNSPKCALRGDCYNENQTIGNKMCTNGTWVNVGKKGKTGKKLDGFFSLGDFPSVSDFPSLSESSSLSGFHLPASNSEDREVTNDPDSNK